MNLKDAIETLEQLKDQPFVRGEAPAMELALRCMRFLHEVQKGTEGEVPYEDQRVFTNKVTFEAADPVQQEVYNQVTDVLEHFREKGKIGEWTWDANPYGED